MATLPDSLNIEYHNIDLPLNGQAMLCTRTSSGSVRRRRMQLISVQAWSTCEAILNMMLIGALRRAKIIGLPRGGHIVL